MSLFFVASSFKVFEEFDMFKDLIVLLNVKKDTPEKAIELASYLANEFYVHFSNPEIQKRLVRHLRRKAVVDKCSIILVELLFMYIKEGLTIDVDDFDEFCLKNLEQLQINYTKIIIKLIKLNPKPTSSSNEIVNNMYSISCALLKKYKMAESLRTMGSKSKNAILSRNSSVLSKAVEDYLIKSGNN